jgi:putative transposase
MRADDVEYACPVTFMCAWLGVSTSGYYDWRKRPLSATAQRRERLTELIRKAFDMSDGTYGYRRVHAQLVRWGWPCSPELVRALMRRVGLVGCQPRPRRMGLTRHAAAPASDLVGRDFTADTPGTKMVEVVTYIPTGGAGSIWRPSSTAAPKK